jgi:hypothetical protein
VISWIDDRFQALRPEFVTRSRPLSALFWRFRGGLGQPDGFKDGDHRRLSKHGRRATGLPCGHGAADGAILTAIFDRVSFIVVISVAAGYTAALTAAVAMPAL